VQPKETINPSLLTEKTLYVQADVRDREQIRGFRDTTVGFFRERNLTPDRLGVVACAGISRREDPVQVKLMQDINEGGTFNLLSAFANDIPVGHGLFVGLSSIVAAEGIAVKGDEEYKATKAEAGRIATDEARKLGVEGFALAPGAIDTPMTRHEAIFGMMMLGAARIFGGDSSHPLHAEVLRLAGVQEGATPATILKGLLGAGITQTADFEAIDGAFAKDPQLARIGVVRFTGFVSPKGPNDERHVRPEVIARAAEILAKLDVVIGPEVVVRLMLDQFETGHAPQGGLLRAYSASGKNPILQLLSAFSG